MGSHHYVGARHLLDLLVVDHNELVLEVTSEAWQRTTDSVCSFLIAASLAVSVPTFSLVTLDAGFSIDCGAVKTNHEEFSPETWQERGQLLTVLVEPSEYGSGLSSRMVLRDSSGSWQINTRFTVDAG